MKGKKIAENFYWGDEEAVKKEVTTEKVSEMKEMYLAFSDVTFPGAHGMYILMAHVFEAGRLSGRREK